jgi:D-alanyl-D-alanine carboxypeptidase/D-alanyl-D-alanine-endopeptidase (penicillin-binding protein 4)
MKSKYLFFFLLIITISYPQNTIKQLHRKIENLSKDKLFETSFAGIDIYNLSTKKILYQENNTRLFRPASNMKILTSAAGLKYLGQDYQFKTSLYYVGEIVDSILFGHVYVVGGCDPDFTSNDLEILILNLKNLGIKSITGNLYGDVSMKDSLFWGNGWMWDDDPSTDAPYLSALNINDNAVTIIAEYDKANDAMKIVSIPQTGYVNFEFKNDSIQNDRRITIDRDWINRKNKFVIEGNFSARNLGYRNTIIERLNIYNPALYFLTLFEEALSRNGIKFTGDLKIKSLDEHATQIYTFERSYDSVIVNLNKTSDNLSAEMTLLALADKYFGKPASAKNGLKMIDSLIVLCGLEPDEYRLVDGSGVSHYNLVSSELLLAILKHFYYEEPALFQVLYNSFPIAGVDGTLKNRMRNSKAENNVHAKTGTISGVSSLSGYVKNRKGNVIAFSIMVQNYYNNSNKARDFIDNICEILADSNL